MKSARAIVFDYMPSRWLVVAVTCVAVFAFVAVVLSGMPLWAKIAAAIAAGVCAVHSLRRFWRPSARRAAWHEDGHWRIVGTDGVEHIADLDHAVVRGAWIVLRLQRNDKRRLALVLGPDNCDADMHRRLRVRLARVRDETKANS